jgi:hypothetical protein
MSLQAQSLGLMLRLNKPLCLMETRFDIIGIILNTKGQKIDHIEGAFQPSW